jgi:large subunit ribosomal protein L22
VSKGQKLVRADIKGRGRTGRKEHPSARIHFLLKEGKSKQEQEERQYQKAMGQIRSAGVVREDGVIRRKVVSGWTW